MHLSSIAIRCMLISQVPGHAANKVGFESQAVVYGNWLCHQRDWQTGLFLCSTASYLRILVASGDSQLVKYDSSANQRDTTNIDCSAILDFYRSLV